NEYECERHQHYKTARANGCHYGSCRCLVRRKAATAEYREKDDGRNSCSNRIFETAADDARHIRFLGRRSNDRRSRKQRKVVTETCSRQNGGEQECRISPHFNTCRIHQRTECNGCSISCTDSS